MAKFINLTPHDIVVGDPSTHAQVIRPSGTVARVVHDSKRIGTLDGRPIHQQTYAEVVGLPDEEARQAGSTWYIVSRMVLDMLYLEGESTLQVVAPDTGPTAIRDRQGRILGITQWIG